MKNNLSSVLAAVGAVIVSVALVAVFHIGAVKQEATNAFGTIGSGWTNLTSLSLSGMFELLGSTGYPGVQLDASSNTCNTATSTWFSVKSPFNATSTAIVWVSGIGNATSTTLNIGTTTQATGLTSTSPDVSLVNNALIATSSPQYYIVSGLSTFLGTGQVSAGTSAHEIVVGPNEYVGAYATSTYGSAGALGYVQTPCSFYKIEWKQ